MCIARSLLHSYITKFQVVRLRSKKTKTIIDTKLLLSFFSLSSTECNLKFNSWLVSMGRSVIVGGAIGDAIKYK